MPDRKHGKAALEAEILDLLHDRDPAATACPSEVARRAFGEDWREHMDDVRAAAGRLQSRGLVEVTQRGQPVDLETARGPLRLRLRRGA